MISLSDLQTLKPYISIPAIARLIDMNPQTLYARLRKGSPELSITQSMALGDLFRTAHLMPVPNWERENHESTAS